MEYIYWLSVLIVPGLPALGVGLMGLTPPEFGLARSCFVATAVWVAVVGSIWIWKTDASQVIRIAAGILIGAVVFVALPESLRWIARRDAPPPTATVPTPPPTAPSATPVILAIGSFPFIEFKAEIRHDIKAKRVSVQPMVELRNTSDVLIKYQARVSAVVNGKKAREFIEFDGYAAPNVPTYLVYDTVFDIPVKDRPTLEEPQISGTFEYDVKYFPAVSYSSTVVRRTSRTVTFRLMGKVITGKPGTTEYQVTVFPSHEIEE